MSSLGAIASGLWARSSDRTATPHRTLMAIQLRVRELVERRGMTQTELQARTGLAYSTVSDLYHGRVRRIELDTLDVLCAALRCKVGDLVEYVPDR
jgi:putative transcriptional regulator